MKTAVSVSFGQYIWHSFLSWRKVKRKQFSAVIFLFWSACGNLNRWT